MNRIALMTDSGSDLPEHIRQRHHITVIPLLIHFDGEDFPDEPGNRENFWQRVADGGIPHTAAPAPDVFAQAYRRALNEADEVLMITLTSKHSSIYQNAVLAAADFGDRVHIFDSWALSVGEGLMVLKAASLIAQGLPTPDILARLHDARDRLHVFIYLNSLDAIRRGGRIALAMNAIKHMSAMLSIRVILEMKEGELKIAGAVRSPKKGMQFMLRTVADMQAEAVAIAHTRAPSLAERLADLAAPVLQFPRQEMLVTEAGPILGTHGGARAYGLTFIESSNARFKTKGTE